MRNGSHDNSRGIQWRPMLDQKVWRESNPGVARRHCPLSWHFAFSASSYVGVFAAGYALASR